MKKEEAEKHWQYTEKVILIMLELVHVLYIEAMIHGDKHDSEDKE